MFTKHDKQGAYVDIPDDDNDLVTLIKQGDQYIYRVIGDAIDKLARFEHLELFVDLKESICRRKETID